MENKITVNELRVLANNFFDSLEKEIGAKEILIKETMYWHVLTDEKYDVLNQPTNLGVGNLLDDLEFLHAVLVNKDLAVLPNLCHFASLIDYLSNGINFAE